MFKKCNFEKPPKTNHEAILENPNLPSDVKMKLYNQAKVLSRQKEEDKGTFENVIETNHEDEDSYIIRLFPEKDQPFISSILDKIRDKKEQLSWNDNLEITIDNKLYRHSNIIELLKLIMKHLIITADMDIPIGAKDFVEKLSEIGVPKSWIRVTFRRQVPKRKAVTRISDKPFKIQRGEGWLVY